MPNKTKLKQKSVSDLDFVTPISQLIPQLLRDTLR
jgi:hypothetical protein